MSPVFFAKEQADNVGVEANTPSPEEIQKMKARVSNWSSQETIKKAQKLIGGKTKDEARKEIFQNFDNDLKPISYVPEQYLPYFNDKATDNRVYSGMAYFIDHAINRHPNMTQTDYRNIQEMLNMPDEVIVDRRMDNQTKKPRDNLLFVKKYTKNNILVISLGKGDDGKIIFHKSLYSDKKTPYSNLPRIQGVLSGGGISPIGSATNMAPGGSLSARDDTPLSP
jgi:hypothetical protein